MSDVRLRELERVFQLSGSEDDGLLQLREQVRVNGGKMIKTTDPLMGTGGFIVAEKYIDARRPGTIGRLAGYVGGHGGDVWWVVHPDMTAAAYSTHEIVGEDGGSAFDE